MINAEHVVVEPAGTRESATDGFSDEARNGKRVSVERALYEFQNGRIGPGGRAAVCSRSFSPIERHGGDVAAQACSLGCLPSVNRSALQIDYHRNRDAVG